MSNHEACEPGCEHKAASEKQNAGIGEVHVFGAGARPLNPEVLTRLLANLGIHMPPPMDAPGATEEPTPAWVDGINGFLDHAFDDIVDEAEAMQSEPVAACIFTVYENGEVAMVTTGAATKLSERYTMLLGVMNAIKRDLANHAAMNKAEELLVEMRQFTAKLDQNA